MRRAGWVLAWENFWRLAWPLPAWFFLFVAVALTDLLPRLPSTLHGAVLALFAGGFLVLAVRLRHFRWPSRTERQKRLEQDSGLAHRPLAQWHDRPAAGRDAIGRALWRLQRQRLKALLPHLRLRPPAPGLPARDPLGLRFVPLLLLAIAAAGARQDIGGRLERALEPGLEDGTPPPALQIWITPPAYTGWSPIMLRPEQAEEEVRIPEGSHLLAELQGSESEARLLIDERKLTFTRLDAVSQKLETELTSGRSLTLRLGRHRLGRWRIALLPDQPPSVAFAAPPAPLPDGRVRIRIAARDDYGVTGLGLLVSRTEGGEGESEQSLPGGGQKEVSSDSLLDLTAHPWSGFKVRLRPVATDAAGHRSLGEPATLRLPEREFRHPVARAVAAVRRGLIADGSQRLTATEQLAQLAGQPAAFGSDATVFLLLATARARLIHDQSPDAIPSVIDLLWAAALRIEEGDLQDARKAVDQASQALAEALDKGASDEEISRLTEQLDQAVRKLLDSLAKHATAANAPPSGPAAKALTPEQLQAMLDQLGDLAHAGARDAARQSLQRLQSLLDRLSAGESVGTTGQQWQESLDSVQSLAQSQKDLLDRAFRRAQQPAAAKQSAKAEQEAQQKLREQLQKLMQSLPGQEASPALGQALQAMQQAEQEFQKEEGDPQGAEGRALAKLQEAARQMQQAMAQSEGQASGTGQDPLGRTMPGGGATDDSQVKVPSQGDLGKSREILDELRRRVGEPDRPAAERAYLRRLLDKLY